MRNYKNIIFLSSAILLFTACSPKSFHDDVVEDTKKSLNKQDYKVMKKSYAESLVDEIEKEKKYISILEDKSLGDILKELEILDGNFYYLKSSDVLVPKSRIKISNIEDLNNYLNAVLDKELVIKKSNNLFLVKLLNASERKKQSITNIPFNLNGQITVEELIKLITVESGYEVDIGSFIENRDDFQNSIITISWATCRL